MRDSGFLPGLLCLAWLAGTAPGQALLLIPESTNDSVQSFDPTTGAWLGVAVPADPTNLSTPIDTAINATGILVSDQVNDIVQQYDPAGVFLGSHTGTIDNLRGIAVRAGVLYCTGGNLDFIPSFDLATGASLGDFIPAGSGGLDSPFDILFRRGGDVLVTSINTDSILQYDATGAPLGVFATNIPFGEQLFEAANDNVLVADFTRNAVIELSPTGVELNVLTGVSGCRGVYELPGGNVLTTNGTGVYELDRTVGGIVDTKLAGMSFRFIELTGPAVPPATCTLAGPLAVASGDVTLDLDASSASAPAVDATFEFSTDAGATWQSCTAAPSSPLPNPAAAVPTGPSTFLWDSVADGVGTLALQPGVLGRATVDDLAGGGPATCDTPPFDVDNSALCTTLCGDCDTNGMGPSILDALTAAQIAAGLLIPTVPQTGCCDVDAGGTIGITDALRIAQVAAGLAVVLTCP